MDRRIDTERERRKKKRETQREGDIEREREGESEPQPPFGPSVGSLCHPCITTTDNAPLLYRFPIFETSATALCGTP